MKTYGGIYGRQKIHLSMGGSRKPMYRSKFPKKGGLGQFVGSRGWGLDKKEGGDVFEEG